MDRDCSMLALLFSLPDGIPCELHAMTCLSIQFYHAAQTTTDFWYFFLEHLSRASFYGSYSLMALTTECQLLKRDTMLDGRGVFRSLFLELSSLHRC